MRLNTVSCSNRAFGCMVWLVPLQVFILLSCISLPGAHFSRLSPPPTPPTPLNHARPSTTCFCPSITSKIWLLTQLPAPLRGPRPGSRTPVNTWLGLKFGEGWDAGCPDIGSGPFGSLLRLERQLGARQLSALDWEFCICGIEPPELQFPHL